MKKLTYLTLVILLLSACGSGGTEPVDPPTEPVDSKPPVADLSVTFEERSADPIAKDASFAYFVNVRNNGSAKATDVKLSIKVPFSITEVPEGCSLTGLTLACGLGELEVGFDKGVLISGKATEEGVFPVTATVSSAVQDPDLSNNSAEENFEVVGPGTTPQPLADLQVEIAERSSDPLPQGNTFAYNISAKNNGNSRARNVKLTVTVPFPLDKVPDECNLTGSTLECDLGELEVGSRKEIAVSGKATKEGLFSISAKVAADTRDPDLSNNSTAEDFNVLPTASVPDLRGQVTSWNGNQAVLSAVLYGKASDPSKVASGTIGADGKLEVFLNKEISGDFLTALPACPGLTQTNPDARQNSFSDLAVTEGTQTVGRVALTSSPAVITKGLQMVGDYYVQQTYSNAANTLQGSCATTGAVNAVFKYDLKLTKGWNAVTFKLAAKNGGSQTVELSSGTPQGAAWVFAP